MARGKIHGQRLARGFGAGNLDEHARVDGVNCAQHRLDLGVISPTLFSMDGANGAGYYDGDLTSARVFGQRRAAFPGRPEPCIV